MLTLLKYICSLIFVSTILLAQVYKAPRSFALGEATVSLKNDVWAIQTNPANSNSINRLVVSTYYLPSPFGMSELSTAGFVVVNNTKFGNFAFAGNLYGFDLYKESTISLSYCNRFFKELTFGTTLNYNSLSIKNYGSKGVLSLDLGLSSDILKDLTIGAALKNLSGSKWTSDQKLSTIYGIGISYYGLEDLMILTEVEKELNYDLDFKFGAEYTITKMLFFRTGFKTLASILSFGLGLNIYNIDADYGINYHNELGFTHNFGLTLQF